MTLPIASAVFTLYTNYSFVSVEDLAFDEETEELDHHSKTFQNLLNLCIMKSLKVLNDALLNQGDINQNYITASINTWLDEKAQAIRIEEDTNTAKFTVDVFTLFGKDKKSNLRPIKK